MPIAPALKRFDTEVELTNYVDALNETGLSPELAIIDSAGISLLACLQAPGGDGWAFAYYAPNDEDGYIVGAVDGGRVRPARSLDAWLNHVEGDWRPTFPVFGIVANPTSRTDMHPDCTCPCTHCSDDDHAQCVCEGNTTQEALGERNDMNQLAAMRETLTRAEDCGMGDIDGFPEGCDYRHLQDMVERAETAMGTAGVEFSDAKLGRWLGWMQGTVVAAGIGLTLDDMKQINRRHAG